MFLFLWLQILLSAMSSFSCSLNLSNEVLMHKVVRLFDDGYLGLLFFSKKHMILLEETLLEIGLPNAFNLFIR